MERRQSKRLNTFWLAYEEETLLGYISDLSEKGIRFWVKNDLKIDDHHFNLKVFPPDEIGNHPITLHVNKIWDQKEKHGSYHEVGGQFNNLSHKEKENLNQLINIFSQDNNKFFSDLDDLLKTE